MNAFLRFTRSAARTAPRDSGSALKQGDAFLRFARSQAKSRNGARQAGALAQRQKSESPQKPMNPTRGQSADSPKRDRPTRKPSKTSKDVAAKEKEIQKGVEKHQAKVKSDTLKNAGKGNFKPHRPSDASPDADNRSAFATQTRMFSIKTTKKLVEPAKKVYTSPVVKSDAEILGSHLEIRKVKLRTEPMFKPVATRVRPAHSIRVDDAPPLPPPGMERPQRFDLEVEF